MRFIQSVVLMVSMLCGDGDCGNGVLSPWTIQAVGGCRTTDSPTKALFGERLSGCAGILTTIEDESAPEFSLKLFKRRRSLQLGRMPYQITVQTTIAVKAQWRFRNLLLSAVGRLFMIRFTLSLTNYALVFYCSISICVLTIDIRPLTMDSLVSCERLAKRTQICQKSISIMIMSRATKALTLIRVTVR